jgi:hypothetical protein
MKKQLLIAAVAATMASVSMADISITGGAKVNYTYTDYDLATSTDGNKFQHDIDLTVVGQSGATQVVVTMANDTADGAASGTAQGFDLENRYVSSSIADVNVKVGSWDNGDDFVSASARADGKFSANTTISGVKVTYDASGTSGATTAAASNVASETVTVAGSMGGVNASYKQETAGEEIKLSTTVAGVSLAYHADNSDDANSDRSSIEVSGEVSGVKVAYVQIDADTSATIEGDSWAGDFEGASGAYNLTAGQDVAAIKVSTAVAGNTVAFTRTDVDGVASADTSFNKLSVTRPLASGATFEMTYTTIDDDVTANDADILDLELAVKF